MGEFARTPCHMLHDVGFVSSLNLIGGVTRLKTW